MNSPWQTRLQMRELHQFIADTPTETLAGALLKLRRLGAWDDGSSGRWDMELLEDIVAVMEREIARQRRRSHRAVRLSPAPAGLFLMLEVILRGDAKG
jgi:hypothetical protein